MQTSRFSNARVLLAEPKVGLRTQMVAALEQAGFGHIVQTGNLAGVHKGLNEGGVDLLIADTVMPEGDLCDLITDVRHSKIGDNPFLVIIALISDSVSEIIRRAVDAGADDILLKPIEPMQVIERVNTLVRGRKRFVVTTDYIGPDRRTRSRAEGEPIPQVKVPNPLEMIGVAGMKRSAMAPLIKQAFSSINREKVERHVFQLDWLSARITPHIEGAALLPADFFRDCLYRLRDVSADLSARIRETELNHIASLCITLERVSRECALEPNSKDLGRWNLLVRLLDSLPRACDPSRGGIAPKAQQQNTSSGVSTLLDKQTTNTFGPGGRITRSA